MAKQDPTHQKPKNSAFIIWGVIVSLASVFAALVSIFGGGLDVMMDRFIPHPLNILYLSTDNPNQEHVEDLRGITTSIYSAVRNSSPHQRVITHITLKITNVQTAPERLNSILRQSDILQTLSSLIYDPIVESKIALQALQHGKTLHPIIKIAPDDTEGFKFVFIVYDKEKLDPRTIGTPSDSLGLKLNQPLLRLSPEQPVITMRKATLNMIITDNRNQRTSYKTTMEFPCLCGP